MKIVVCGDSWMSTDVRIPGCHFSEILQSQHNHEVINLARGGISNFGICLQLKQAAELQPDIIIFNTTSSVRGAFALSPVKADAINLKDIQYIDSVSGSCGSSWVGGNNAPIIDDVLLTLAQNSDWTIFAKNKKYNIPAEVEEAIKTYISYLHNKDLQELTDNWMTGYWEYTLKEKNIPFINLSKDTFSREFFKNPDRGNQWVFHTTKARQIQLANKVIELISQIFNNN